MGNTKNNTKPAALILVADDDPSIRLMTRHILERDGYTVVEAADGQQALTLYKQKQPDLVLLDAMMPDLDGFEACTQIRRLPDSDRVPILIITVLNDSDSVSRAFAAGATDYIIKPIHWVVLRRRVQQQLRAAQIESALRKSEERYRILVETSPNAIALIDLNFAVIFCNQQAVRLHNYRQVSQMIGKEDLLEQAENGPEAI